MTDELAAIVTQAAREGWRIRPPTLEARPILAGGVPVGFFCPHPAARGRTRVGPIYVLPAFRGQGLGLHAYAWADASTPLMAYVHDANQASERLHELAGFARWKRGRGGWYWRRG